MINKINSTERYFLQNPTEKKIGNALGYEQ